MDKIARLKVHLGNIERYENLLKTRVSEIEAKYLERRLSEERLATVILRFTSAPSDESKGHYPTTPHESGGRLEQT